MRDYKEDNYPDNPINEFNIKITRDKDTGIYILYCREFKCEYALPEVAPWKGVAELVEEIVYHNELA